MQAQAEPGMNLQWLTCYSMGSRQRAACGLVVAVMLAWTCAVAVAAADVSVSTAQDGLVDAEQFARLVERTAYRPSAREIRTHYLEVGSPALKAFAMRRSTDANTLRDALVNDREAYRRAVARCLPAARAVASRWSELTSTVADLLAIPVLEAEPRPVFLFGAGRSAGTVQDNDVVIALEVVCRYAGSGDSAERVLEGFALHELVHVHQLRLQQSGQEESLLRQALIEGFADYATERLLGASPSQERERVRYGMAHESQLWTAFSAERRGIDLGRWMYGPGRPGEPADLGYWVGKRICAAYVDASDDEAQALRELLELRDPEGILARSGYPARIGVP